MDLNVQMSVVIDGTNKMPMFCYTNLDPHCSFFNLYIVLLRHLYSFFE